MFSLREALSTSRARYTVIYGLVVLGLVLLLLASWQKLDSGQGLDGPVGAIQSKSIDIESIQPVAPVVDEEPVMESGEPSVLAQLLAKDWPDSDLTLDVPEGQKTQILSREEFVQASSKQYDMRAEMKARAYEAPLDETGHYILLPNNRFFAIERAADDSFEERKLYLHYEGLEPEMEQPVVRLFPHAASRLVEQSIHASVAVTPPRPSAELTMHKNAMTLPLGAMASMADAWVIHVDTVSLLGEGPKRYLVYFK